MSIRDELNKNDPNRMAAAFSRLGGFGEAMNRFFFGAARGAAVATANAATQTASYVQVDVQTIATLANSLKTAFNNLVTSSGGVTEAALSPTANVVTLAAQPVAVIDVNVATVSSGSATGSKKLRIGPFTGPGAITPAAGECVWDGGLKVKLASADLAATVNVAYTKATDVSVSAMQADLDR